jgi:hypothetical protein
MPGGHTDAAAYGWEPAGVLETYRNGGNTMQATTTHSTRRFVRHYVEMVAVMFIGMFALSKPADLLFGAFGASTSSEHPVMMLFSMGITMTVPMVAWMRYRGHAWRPTNEMAASMLIPTFAAMALVGAGVMTGGSAMVAEHIAMLAGMLVAMLLRRDDYAGAHAHHGAQQALAG